MVPIECDIAFVFPIPMAFKTIRLKEGLHDLLKGSRWPLRRKFGPGVADSDPARSRCDQQE
jgi:hypothetical protein